MIDEKDTVIEEGKLMRMPRHQEGCQPVVQCQQHANSVSVRCPQVLKWRHGKKVILNNLSGQTRVEFFKTASDQWCKKSVIITLTSTLLVENCKHHNVPWNS